MLKGSKKSVRVCGDFKQTINPSLPPVLIDTLFPWWRICSLHSLGPRCFSKIDLSQAYQQILLEKGSRQYVLINTHKDLFRYTRVSSDPRIFQRVTVHVYINDIIVAGATEEEHLKRMENVLTRLERAGLRVQKSMCQQLPEQVPVHEGISYLPWTQSGCRWNTPSSRESGGSCEGSHTLKSQRAEVLLGALVLLQQISLKPVISSCPYEPSTP